MHLTRYIKYKFILLGVGLLSIASCTHDPVIKPAPPKEATPYNLELPPGFPPMEIPADNPMTVEGVELGRKLFYDIRLSGNNTQSCADCHITEFGYSDSARFSLGIDGLKGKRNAMAVINVGYNIASFWDGRAKTLEEQALMPVTDPLEMHANWPDVLVKLNADQEYRDMFKVAFKVDVIDSLDVAKAIAQFERTMISGNSRFDKYVNGALLLEPNELRGFQVFATERGDCFHCHGTSLLMGFAFENNGLQQTMEDIGYGKVTGLSTDEGKFRPPTLRNIALTAPYMHDSRFTTLEEVVEFYNSGVNQSSPNISPLMLKANRPNGSLNLTAQEKADLVAFLKTLTDEDFINNKSFQDPNK
ncbi:c-type cytochrome [bacterium SCSIO 12643]|nr:c-type cytochrome [bacterium SCSIO 12643]